MTDETSEQKLLQELKTPTEIPEEDDETFMESSFGRGTNKKVILTTRGYTLQNIVQLAK